MIKNIIFDMGNVLVDFNPPYFLKKLIQEPEEREAILKELYASAEWRQIDEGTIEIDKAFEQIAQRLPKYKEGLKKVLYNWFEHMLPINGSLQIVKELKAAGYKLYLLSNAGVQFHTYSKNFEVFKYFDALDISADMKIVKPNKDIYLTLLKKHGLEASECLFIDDLEKNTQGAAAVGINSYIFSTPQALYEYLCSEGILKAYAPTGLYAEIAKTVKEVGEEIINLGSVKVYNKENINDFVTDADYYSQNELRKRLSALDSSIGFQSEEDTSNVPKENQMYFLIDPIDGTTNFMHNLSLSCISLALCQNDYVLFGVIYNPFTKEFFIGEKGKGAYLNGRRIFASSRPAEDSLIIFDEVTGRDTVSSVLKVLQECLKFARGIRCFGSAALEISYIACGRADAYFQPLLNTWDYAAAVLILQEAGGVGTDWEGNSLKLSNGTVSILTANPVAYGRMLELCKDTQ